MKTMTINNMKRSVGALCSLLLLASCTDWDDHFDASGLSASGVEVYNGDIVSYVQSTAELSKMSQLYQRYVGGRQLHAYCH